MKKTISIIILFIAFIITYFLQANFFSWFTIAGIQPNLFIILVLFVGLYAGMKVSIPYGVTIGVILDIIMGKTIGIYTIMYGVAAIAAGYLDKNFSKDSRFTFIVMIIVVTAILEIINYILNIVIFSTSVEIISFCKVLSIEIIYNSILTIILYPIMQTLGYKLENIFKAQKVLTRYF